MNLWDRITHRAEREELKKLDAELDLLLYALAHPGEVIHVPEGHPARNGVLADAWRPK